MSQLPRNLAPFRASLEPENLGGDVATLGGIEKKSRNLRICLSLPEVEFVSVVLAQRFRIDTDDARNVSLRNPIGGHGFHLPAHSRIWNVGFAPHQADFRCLRTSANGCPSSCACSPVNACQRWMA